MRLQENNLIMEQYSLINEKKKLPKGFVPFKKGHGKKKGKEDDKKDTKSKKKNPFASLKKESADIYATMSEAPMSGDDMQLQSDAGINDQHNSEAMSWEVIKQLAGELEEVELNERIYNAIKGGKLDLDTFLSYLGSTQADVYDCMNTTDGEYENDPDGDFRQSHADGDQDAINWAEQ